VPEPRELHETDVDADPVVQLRAWLAEAERVQGLGWDTMVLATVADGRPSARAVILRGLDERGFVFFTDYRSRKARELEATGWAAVALVWPALERQVRAEGPVARVRDEESDAYFAGRPRGSRLAAWASHQSEVIAGRSVLEQRVAELIAEYDGREVPRPPFWGGYRLAPADVELWQGRPDRLHDRLRYRRVDGRWVLERLSP
jgi:pyridoxamine 5'-phosphate oxidase